MTYADGGRYEGDLRHGEGVMTFPAGRTRYEGAFADGRPHGRGRLSYADGDAYEGEIADGQPHGRGVLTYDGGSRHEGTFEDGLLHGPGVMAY